MQTSKEVKEYLAGLSAEERKICTKLREVVLRNMPGCNELIAHSALGYSTTASSFDRIAYIAPQSGWTNLGFFFGSDIPDPGKLLTGTGKRMRHIKIKEAAQADNPAIDAILQAAWQKAPADIEGIHKRGKKKTT